MSEESCRKMSAAQKRLWREGFYEKPICGQNRFHSPESRQRQREAMKRLWAEGKIQPKEGKSFGHPWTLESRRKASESAKRPSHFNPTINGGYRTPKGTHNSPTTEFKVEDPRTREIAAKARASRKRWGTRTSKPEIRLQTAMRNAQINFEPNKSLGFCAPDAVIENDKLAVFCDGDYWHHRPEVVKRDIRITKSLEDSGWMVFRFWEHEINEDVNRCVAAVGEAILLGGGVS